MFHVDHALWAKLSWPVEGISGSLLKMISAPQPLLYYRCHDYVIGTGLVCLCLSKIALKPCRSVRTLLLEFILGQRQQSTLLQFTALKIDEEFILKCPCLSVKAPNVSGFWSAFVCWAHHTSQVLGPVWWQRNKRKHNDDGLWFIDKISAFPEDIKSAPSLSCSSYHSKISAMATYFCDS